MCYPVPSATKEILNEAVLADTITSSGLKKDGLIKIEGIGKKTADVLITAGISTFEDLSKSTPKKIRIILDAAGNKFKLIDPITWPKQAKLAAAGKWPELKKLQEKLKSAE